MNLECLEFNLCKSRRDSSKKKNTHFLFPSTRAEFPWWRYGCWVGDVGTGLGLFHASHRALLLHHSCPNKKMLLEHSDMPGDLGLYITHQISTTRYLFPKPPHLLHLPFFCHLLQIFHPFHLPLTTASPFSCIPSPSHCVAR